MHGVVEVLERIAPKHLAYLHVLDTMFLVFDGQDQLALGDEVPFHLPAENSLAFDLEAGHRLGGQQR